MFNQISNRAKLWTLTLILSVPVLVCAADFARIVPRSPSPLLLFMLSPVSLLPVDLPVSTPVLSNNHFQSLSTVHVHISFTSTDDVSAGNKTRHEIQKKSVRDDKTTHTNRACSAFDWLQTKLKHNLQANYLL